MVVIKKAELSIRGIFAANERVAPITRSDAVGKSSNKSIIVQINRPNIAKGCHRLQQAQG